jgi:BlaI family penicillinase repressor
MPKSDKIISPAEFRILEILWDNSPLSASEIVNSLAEVESWHSRTIKTLISRLLKKNIVGFKEDGHKYLYFPLIKKHDYLKTTSENFIQRLFGGKISPLVAHFAKQEKISKEDIEELKAILAALEE